MRDSVQSTSVSLSGLNSIFLQNRVNITQRGWEHRVEVLYKSFFERTEESANFQGTFL